MKVLQFPLTRVTLFFILGILVAFFIQPDPKIAFSLLLLSTSITILLYFFAQRNFAQKINFGIGIYILSLSAGIGTQIAHTDYYKQNHFIQYCTVPEQTHLIEITLKEKLKSTIYNERYIADVKKIDQKNCLGKILLNVEKDSLKSNIEIGSKLKISGKIYKHKLPNNPDQFDYGKYLANKSIAAQLFADGGDIQINSSIEKNVWFYAAQLRNKIVNNLEKSNFNKEELNVVVALILGQQQDIAPEILHDYQFAGAVHVLSVSGLHVGFLLLFINLLLSRVPKNRIGNSIRFITVFISLWAFAIIAGLSPSVVRSVTMFTFIAAGMHLKRENNIFHTLIISMLLILSVSPSFLFDVGFQLSYVSLFFILWLQPLFSHLWKTDNRILKYFWDILTVSFAAQIGALPLSIYYFHQFPGLFFITNLIVLPGLGFIMALGVFVMIFAAFDLVFAFPAKILEMSIQILNGIIKWIASFEQFIIQDIPLNLSITIALYFLIIAFVSWFKKTTFKNLLAGLASVFLLQLLFVYTNYENQQKQEFLVFHAKRNTIVSIRDGDKITLKGNDSVLNKLRGNRIVNSYIVANFIKEVKKEELQNLLFYKGNKILLIDSLGVFPKAMNPDIIILTQSPKINLERLLKQYNPKIIVADGSNYKSYVQLWKRSCEKKNIPFHATAEKGYYKLN